MVFSMVLVVTHHVTLADGEQPTFAETMNEGAYGEQTPQEGADPGREKPPLTSFHHSGLSTRRMKATSRQDRFRRQPFVSPC